LNGEKKMSIIQKIRDSNFVKFYKISTRSAKVMTVIGGILSLLLTIFAIFGPLIVPYDPLELSTETLEPPSSRHLMGTDQLGRDLYSRLLVGTKYSLGVSLIAVGISLITGIFLGAISGYFGGPLDRFLTLIMDALYIFPGFIFVLILSVLLGPGIWQTALAVSMGRIPANFRMIRSITLSIKERGFIEAERILGASNLHIIRRHIAPYYVSILFVTISLGLARGTLAISGLGFLGLGIPPPTPEWGTELALGRSVLLRGAWWNVVFPGLFVLIAMLAFNLLSEGLDVIMNPTVRKLK
jgi:peptide/nickel transport system permease protein